VANTLLIFLPNELAPYCGNAAFPKDEREKTCQAGFKKKHARLVLKKHARLVLKSTRLRFEVW
jgi:hypothetical protein